MVGCIGLCPIDAERCKMKRLYVRPHCCGLRLSEALTNHLCAEARAGGYLLLFLDTLPEMLGGALSLCAARIQADRSLPLQPDQRRHFFWRSNFGGGELYFTHLKSRSMMFDRLFAYSGSTRRVLIEHLDHLGAKFLRVC